MLAPEKVHVLARRRVDVSKTDAPLLFLSWPGRVLDDWAP